jgi:hypothetical protein
VRTVVEVTSSGTAAANRRVSYSIGMPFTVSCDAPQPPARAWEQVTDWPQHGRFVPLTTVTVRTPPPNGAGTVFVARTGVGRVGFDDIMEVVRWEPPGPDGRGFCRLEKRGRVMLGWAELTVEPHGTGSRTTWREEARVARTPSFAARPSDAAGRVLFGRVLRKLLGQ